MKESQWIQVMEKKVVLWKHQTAGWFQYRFTESPSKDNFGNQSEHRVMKTNLNRPLTDKKSNSLHKKENIPVLARWSMLGNANPSSSDGSSCDECPVNNVPDPHQQLLPQTIQNHVALARDMYLLQLCSGIDENSIGACAQLVFAPIDESFADDALLLPSGFRVIPLDPKSDVPATSRTLDLASTLEVGSSNARAVGEVGDAYNLRFVLTIAFQFTFENHLRDNVAAIFTGEPEFRENAIYT
ncbi:hypothetical protein KIW84_041397 [Lathyrus oleraceus]|uniref:Uncharacterized protein n=1 Tax=Pisum sativum TaxID=3888 RepID=A0A9D4X837_PEA|nr:hypothetical protein KIW84_041397 [Pisum sativum]